MENTKDNQSMQFESTDVEAVIEKVLAALQGTPKDISDIVLIGAMVAISRIEFEAEGKDPKMFGGFRISARAKDMNVEVTARHAGGFSEMLAAMLGASDGSSDDVIDSLFAALAATKDNPESEDYCDCSACDERRAMMAEANKGPETH